MLIKLKFNRTYIILRTISRIGNTGLQVANFLYWKVIRKYQENIYNRNAVAPFIEITTKIGCNIRCDFCPQDNLLKAHKDRLTNFNSVENILPQETLLKLETFKTFLKHIPKDYIINFAGYSEPWLVPDCTDMVLTAYEKGHKVRAFTTFVGMKPIDVKRLSKIPFELFSVHMADETPTTKIRVDGKMKETIKEVKKRGFYQLEFHNHFGNPHPEFIKSFGKFHFTTASVVNRAENIILEENNTQPKRHKGKIRCGFNPKSNDLTWNVLLPNGDVTLCCEDYSLKHILGNLHDNDLMSLYKTEPYQTIKRGLDDESIDLLCRYCHRAVQMN